MALKSDMKIKANESQSNLRSISISIRKSILVLQNEQKN